MKSNFFFFLSLEQQQQAHKLILSYSSLFFSELFEREPNIEVGEYTAWAKNN
jgi:hypothetical protein